MNNYREIDGELHIEVEIAAFYDAAPIATIEEAVQKAQGYKQVILTRRSESGDYYSAFVGYRPCTEVEVAEYQAMLDRYTSQKEKSERAQYELLKKKFEKKSKKKTNTHVWVFRSQRRHNSEYWYQCTQCGESDWLPYGTAPPKDWHGTCSKKKSKRG